MREWRAGGTKRRWSRLPPREAVNGVCREMLDDTRWGTQTRRWWDTVTGKGAANKGEEVSGE
jgi:hypothetical protein